MKNTFKYFLCVLLACSGMFMLSSCKEESPADQLKKDLKKVEKDAGKAADKAAKDAGKAADKAAKDADKASKDAGIK